VLDLFANARLNHQTAVQGGVLDDLCATELQEFFQGRREAARALHAPVREDALRTAQARFDALGDPVWPAHYVSELPSLNGLRLHYLDTGGAAAATTYLGLHGLHDWSQVFQDPLAGYAAAGHRVVAPDLIGFGKSDKPKREDFHSLSWHVQVLQELLQRLQLRHVVLLAQVESRGLAHALMTSAPQQIAGIEIVKLARLSAAAAQAPYPDRGHEAALRAFAKLLPTIDASP
jgi:tRNA(adenine34) deaminase